MDKDFHATISAVAFDDPNLSLQVDYIPRFHVGSLKLMAKVACYGDTPDVQNCWASDGNNQDTCTLSLCPGGSVLLLMKLFQLDLFYFQSPLLLLLLSSDHILPW